MHISAKVTLCLGLLAAGTEADAACRMPNVFTLTQANGPVVTLRTTPTGASSFDGIARTRGGQGSVSGMLSSTGRLKFTIDWGGNSVGIYTGVVAGGNVEDGRTYDAVNRASWSTWTSNSSINCDDD